MDILTSDDGTPIAYESTGSGSPVVCVGGVFNDRARFTATAEALATHFTVVTYDRRARGDSGDAHHTDDTATGLDRQQTVACEVADLDTVIAAAGGAAAVLGYSSGALLALAAAARGSAITGLVAYEPPFAHDGAEPARPDDLPEQVQALVAEGRHGDAVALYQTRGIGLPPEVVEQIRQAPFWSALEAMAPSVVYDAVLAQPGTITSDTLKTIEVPTLVLSGAETWEGLTRASDVVAQSVPSAQRQVLDGGAGHDLDAAPIAPALTHFLTV